MGMPALIAGTVSCLRMHLLLVVWAARLGLPR